MITVRVLEAMIKYRRENKEEPNVIALNEHDGFKLLACGTPSCETKKQLFVKICETRDVDMMKNEFEDITLYGMKVYIISDFRSHPVAHRVES